MRFFKRLSIVRVFIILLMLVGLGVAYFVVIHQYQEETFRRNDSLYKSNNLTNNPQEEYLDIEATVQAVDAVQKEFRVRLDFLPSDGLSNDGLSPKKDLRYFINNAIGQREFTLKKGEIPQGQDIILQMYDGQVSNYPFDQYNLDLEILVAESPPDGQSLATAESLVPVSVELTLFSSLTHYHIVNQPSHEVGGPHYILTKLEISRSPSTIFYFFFIMTIMALISLTAFIVSITLAINPTKIEAGVRLDLDIFAYLAALLFAFPAMRETMPETPKIGAFGDFLIFFWAEGLLALSLVISVIAWLIRRYQQSDSIPLAPAASTNGHLPEPAIVTIRKEPVEPLG